MDTVPDPLLLRKSSSAGNLTQDLCVCSQEVWPLDDRGGHKNRTNSVAFSCQENYTDWATAAGRRILFPASADGGESRGERVGSPRLLISVF
jgi:hypothetical protein